MINQRCFFMYRHLVFTFTFSLFISTLMGQRNNFAVGFQSGVNSSRTIITNPTFETIPIHSDFFVGSSFGLVARSKLWKYRWEFASFTNQYYVFAEYGLNAAYGGYNYRYENNFTFQEQLTFSAPLLLVIRPAIQKYWYKSFKGKRIFPIVKGGVNFSTTPTLQSNTIHTFGEATLTENIRADNKVNVAFVGALGFQKEAKNGRIIYLGFSVQTPLGSRTSGTILVDTPTIFETVNVAKAGNFYSIDLQYFIGKRTARENRKNKRGKLPKIIHNPRYF